MKNSYLEVIEQLDKFASSFSEINTFDELALAVEKILEDTYGVEYTGLYLFDPVAERFRLLQAKGFNIQEIQEAEKTALERHPGSVYRSGKMIYIPDTQLDQDEITKSSERSFNVRSRLYLPVRNGGQVVGAFGIVDSKPNAYNTEDIAVLSFICNMAGALYRNILNQSQLRKMALIAKENRNAVLILNQAGEIEWVNDAFIRTTEYNPDEIKGKNPHEILKGEETNQNTLSLISDSIRNGKGLEVDLINYTKSNKKYWVSIQIQPVYDSNGELENFISIQKEITNEKEIQENLKKISQAVEQSPVMTFITDLDGIIQYANPKVSELTGYSIEELLGQNPRIFNSKENQQEEYVKLWNTISSGKEWRGEFRNKKKNGDLYWVMASISPVFDQQGSMTNFIAVEEDISQRKEQLNALKIANLRFKSLISSIQAGVMVEDDQRKVVLVNQYFCDLFSIPVQPEYLIGFDCAEAAEVSKLLFTDPDKFINDINSTLSLRQIVTNHELLMKTGTTLERDFVPIDDPENKNQGILWIYRDITERKKDEWDLLRQRQILSGTAMAMNYLLTITNHSLAIQKALEAIGIASEVDRAYIFESFTDELTGETKLNQRFEWTAHGIIPQIDNPDLQSMPFSRDFPRWFELLSNGKPLSGLVKDFPVRERELLESQDIFSIIVVPIFVNDRFWGTVGFDNCTREIQWSENEVSILYALAASIGGSISREIIGKELSNAREVAEKATKIKSDFLATMSHEIRTPMNGVIGMTSLLLQTQLSPDQQDYTETIKISGELLLNLINDILDFSKIESGKMILEEQVFDLRNAIEDVIDLMSTSATQKKLGLYFQVDPAIPEKITGDLTRLRQILVNLVGNAIKFTSEGEVIIKVNQIDRKGDETVIQFSVKDTGMGIPAGKIDQLFIPFSQVDASTTRKYGGTGLGLAICSTLVKLMKGKIWVDSEFNHGSEFLFTIKTKTINQSGDQNPEVPFPSSNPIKRRKILLADSHTTSNDILKSLFKDWGINTLVADSVSKTLEIIDNQSDIDLIIVDSDLPDEKLLAVEVKKRKFYAKIPLILLTYPETEGTGVNGDYYNLRINKPLKQSQLISNVTKLFTSSQDNINQTIIESKQLLKMNRQYPMNILVAEDNTINQKLILRLFEMLGYSISIAANGFEVIETLGRMSIDIIFMDIQMPEMDGFEATKQIIARWGNQKPFIVAMTANALSTDREKCLEAGMDDYISKPITIDQIRIGIQKWTALINAKK